MIGIVDVTCQAQNPNIPLYPMRAYVGSPSSIRVRNVPKRIGDWCIRSVQFTAVYPDGEIQTAECVLTGGIWVGTCAGTATSGTTENGYTIFASGTDENGEPVEGYVLGKGDIEILEADGSLHPGATKYYVHLLSSSTETHNEGDLWRGSDGAWYIWQAGTAYPIGDDSGLIAELSGKIDGKADISALEDYATHDELASGLSTKADLSALHGDYITAGAAGISADGHARTAISGSLADEIPEENQTWHLVGTNGAGAVDVWLSSAG